MLPGKQDSHIGLIYLGVGIAFFTYTSGDFLAGILSVFLVVLIILMPLALLCLFAGSESLIAWLRGKTDGYTLLFYLIGLVIWALLFKLVGSGLSSWLHD